jgi:hypothetical protein
MTKMKFAVLCRGLKGTNQNTFSRIIHAANSNMLQSTIQSAVLLPPRESLQATVRFDPHLKQNSNGASPAAVRATPLTDTKADAEEYSGSLKITTASGNLQVRCYQLAQACTQELYAHPSKEVPQRPL